MLTNNRVLHLITCLGPIAIQIVSRSLMVSRVGNICEQSSDWRKKNYFKGRSNRTQGRGLALRSANERTIFKDVENDIFFESYILKESLISVSSAKKEKKICEHNFIIFEITCSTMETFWISDLLRVGDVWRETPPPSPCDYLPFLISGTQYQIHQVKWQTRPEINLFVFKIGLFVSSEGVAWDKPALHHLTAKGPLEWWRRYERPLNGRQRS